jgi:hypothetical protein
VRAESFDLAQGQAPEGLYARMMSEKAEFRVLLEM